VYKLVHKLRLPGDKIWLKLAQHWQGHTSCKQLFLISRLVDEEEIFFFFSRIRIIQRTWGRFQDMRGKTKKNTYFEMQHSFLKGKHLHILDLFVQFSPKSQTLC
jgi:hypothetical protein